MAPIYDDIIRSIGTRQAAYHLIHRASVLLIHNENVLAQQESKEGKKALEKLDDIADQMDLYQAAMIDGKKINLDQWSATFGSVPELVDKYLQILAAASDIPATRFLGQAPGGLNATGTSDLENYYNAIDAHRSGPLNQQLEKFFNIAMRSEFGKEFNESMTKLEFPPLWNLSESEEATVRGQDTTNIVNAFNAGLIDANFANRELKDRDIYINDPGKFTFIDGDFEQDAESGRSSADLINALKGTDALPEKKDTPGGAPQTEE